MEEPGQAFAIAVYTPFQGLELLGTSNFFFSKFFKNLFLIGRQLLYNIVLASAKEQHESAVSVHISSPWKPAFLS